MSKYPEKIRAYRELTRITQKELAERAGVHFNTLARVEKGEGVNVFQLEKIAKAMGMSLSDLVA